MFINIDYEYLLYNELKEQDINKLNHLLKNNVIRSYLYLLNNIKKNIYQSIFLTETEWLFYIRKLVFLKNVISHNNLKNEYKIKLIDNINEHLRFLNSPS